MLLNVRPFFALLQTLGHRYPRGGWHVIHRVDISSRSSAKSSSRIGKEELVKRALQRLLTPELILVESSLIRRLLGVERRNQMKLFRN